MTANSNLQSLVVLLDDFTLNNQGKFITPDPVMRLPHGEIAKVKVSPDGPANQILSSNKNWTGAVFRVPDEQDSFMVFQISLPKKSKPPLQLRLYLRRSETKYVSLIAIDVIDGYLERFGISPGPLTLASSFIENQPRYNFRLKEDHLLRRFTSDVEGVKLVEQRLMKYEEPAPNPDTLQFSPAHTDSREDLSRLAFSQTAIDRLSQANIRTLGQLATVSYFDLLKFDFMGRKTANEVKEFFVQLLSK